MQGGGRMTNFAYGAKSFPQTPDLTPGLGFGKMHGSIFLCKSRQSVFNGLMGFHDLEY